MSIRVQTSDLDKEIISYINEETVVRVEDSYNGGPTETIYPYRCYGSNTVLPFSWTLASLSVEREEDRDYGKMGCKFGLKLRPHQQDTFQDGLRLLRKSGSLLLSLYCGYGKTALAIKLSAELKLRTLILVHNVSLMKQWEDEIKKFCVGVRVVRVTSKSKYEDADFYIMNAQNVEKKGDEYFEEVGTVIVDEAHKVLAGKTFRALLYAYPRYLIGLSATPYRSDGLNKLFTLFFGCDENKIVKDFYREHIVYKVKTGIKPVLERGFNGKLNWNLVLESLAGDGKRNELILEILCGHRDRNFMVLTKRVSQGYYLERRLLELGESVTTLLESKQEYDREARILIGTVSKIGTGFSHSKLDTLLLASDVDAYFTQYLGRVFRREEGVPVIFDLIDSNPTLEKHYRNREAVYKKHGGVIKMFKKK